MTVRMTKWETNVRQGLSVGISLVVAVVMVDVSLVWMAIDRATETGAVNFGTFIIGLAVLFSLGLLGLMLYWLYGLARSRYLLDRNALIIQWGPTEQTIPTDQIERVLTGDEVEGRIRIYGGVWPGHHVGYGEVPGAGPALFYGTSQPRRQIYVVTPGLTYGVSPADYEGFLDSLRTRLQMGPTQIVEQSSKRPSVLNWDIWRDYMGLALLTIGLLATLGLIGFLCYQFPALPMMIPMHFDATGTPDRFVPRGQGFVIPLIGLLTLLLNGVLGAVLYRRERMASYLLWGGAVLVLTLVWTAALGILGQT
jgi:hypothetical protein